MNHTTTTSRSPVAPLSVAAALLLAMVSVAAQSPPPAVDTTKIGPQVGATAPPFSAVDQLGRTQTLESSLGAKGAMLVFFRSADW
jgi:hypothetical protein